jgi:hypothetical protein
MTDRRHRVGHLAGRFFGSLRARPLSPADVAWVRAALTPEEFAVWQRLGRADRAESLAVGREVQRSLRALAVPVRAESPGESLQTVGGAWIAAALLHDVGKVDAGLGTGGRSAAALVGGLAGHDRARRWRHRSGWRGRVGRYIAHDDLGAAALTDAGARPQAAYWAEVHHRPDRWDGRTIPADVCALLARADGERIQD